ncbi:Sly1 protein [Aphelenchoides avenae]|nr:Sly1 protein [Aphelenchus avenae]
MIGNGLPSVETLRSRQIASLKQVLNLNQPLSNSLAVEPVWKVLVLDGYGQDIISPLLPVKQLRELGVTLHPMLHSDREPLPDVPAVYFVAPTQKNVEKICDDLKRAMYDSFYFNFVSPIPRLLLEPLAECAVQGGTAQQVQKVTDQYVSFITLEDDLFMLRRYTQDSPFSFYGKHVPILTQLISIHSAINDPSLNEEKATDLIDSVANGLFAVCVTLGVVPIIKCPKDCIADSVAQARKKLTEKIRNNLRDARFNLFTQENIRAGQLNLSRPVLVIADRSIDLATMLHHTWTYQAMIHDVLDMDLNRIRMTDKSGKRKEYDMSPEDSLWSDFKGSPFPLVAEAIQERLDEYRKNEDEIKRLKDSMGIQNPEDETAALMIGDATARLQSAVGSLPELLEKKKLIDLHTTLATALLDNVKHRKLDVLFENEEKLLNGQGTDAPLIEALRGCTDKEDVLRLLLINYLCAKKDISAAERAEFNELLQEREIDQAAIRCVQTLKFQTSKSHLSSEFSHQGGGTDTKSMFSKLLSHSSRFVMEGVKNLVPKKHNLPVTSMVDQLVDTRPGVGGISGSNVDLSDFKYYDPKLMHDPKDSSKIRTGQLATDVIVFVVGGGNYVEYQNVHDYGKSKGLQRIVYGCTEMVSPKKFVEQLTRLGQSRT